MVKLTAKRPFGSSSQRRFADRLAKIEATVANDRPVTVDGSAPGDQRKAELAPQQTMSTDLSASNIASPGVEAVGRGNGQFSRVPDSISASKSAAQTPESPAPPASNKKSLSSSAPAAHVNGDGDPIGQVRTVLRESVVAVVVFSVAINILMLTGPLFMLQVYDRAMPSGSVPTLVILFVLVTILYGFFALLEGVRARVFIRLGTRIDEILHKPVYRAMIALTSRDPVGAGPQPMRDLDAVRSYVSGTAPAAFFDIPWVPIYILLIYILHPVLGLFATMAAAVLIGIALLNKRLTQEGHGKVAQATFEAHRFAEEGRRDAPVVRALGMEPALVGEWASRKARAIAQMAQVSDKAGVFSSASKSLRLYFQSAMLALGAWLAIKQEISPGMIIAGTIIMSRGLAPIEQLIGQWHASAGAQRAWKRICDLFDKSPLEVARQTALPAPTGRLEVVNLACFVPNSPKPVLSGIEFVLDAGDGLGIVGPSGAGKSTLVKALLGIWPQTSGAVRLDGAAHNQWNSDVLGQHIGYLPQDATLLPGTVAQNISRFQPRASSQAILEAAKVTGAHDLAVSLANGYDTLVGPDGLQLSIGQAQRIALARAVYNFPPIVALDEPYSNLDADGEHALNQTIRALRARGSTVIVVTHRTSALNALDKVLCIRSGKQALFGQKDEVLRAMTQAVKHLAETQPDTPVRENDRPARPQIVVSSRPSVDTPTNKPSTQAQAGSNQTRSADLASGHLGQATTLSGNANKLKTAGASNGCPGSSPANSTGRPLVGSRAADLPSAPHEDASDMRQPVNRPLGASLAQHPENKGKASTLHQPKIELQRTAETKNTLAASARVVASPANSVSTNPARPSLQNSDAKPSEILDSGRGGAQFESDGSTRTMAGVPQRVSGHFIKRDAATPRGVREKTLKIDAGPAARVSADQDRASDAQSEAQPERAGARKPFESTKTDPVQEHRTKAGESTCRPTIGSPIWREQTRSDASKTTDAKADPVVSKERGDLNSVKSAGPEPTARPVQTVAHQSEMPEATGSVDMKRGVASNTIPSKPDLQVDRKAEGAASSKALLKDELAQKLEAIQRQFERISGTGSGHSTEPAAEKSQDRLASLLRLRDELEQIKAHRRASKSNG